MWSENDMNEKDIYFTTFDILELLLDIATSEKPIERLEQKIEVYENKLSAFDKSSIEKLKKTYNYHIN